MVPTEAQTVPSVPVMWKDTLQVIITREDACKDLGIKVTAKTKDLAKGSLLQ